MYFGKFIIFFDRIRFPEVGCVWRYAHVVEGTSERLTKAWELKQKLGPPDSAPSLTASGSGQQAIPDPSAKKTKKGQDATVAPTTLPPAKGQPIAPTNNAERKKKRKVGEQAPPAEEPEHTPDKKEMGTAGKNLDTSLNEYRSVIGTAESIMDCIKTNPQWTEWISEDGKLGRELKESIEVVKQSLPDITRKLIMGQTMAAVKKATDAQSFVKESNAAVDKMRAHIDGLRKRCERLTGMHAARTM